MIKLFLGYISHGSKKIMRDKSHLEIIQRNVCKLYTSILPFSTADLGVRGSVPGPVMGSL